MINSRSFNVGHSGTYEAFLNHTPTSYSNYKVLAILRDTNNSNNHVNGIMPFREDLLKPDILRNFRLNEIFVISSLNRQNL